MAIEGELVNFVSFSPIRICRALNFTILVAITDLIPFSVFSDLLQHETKYIDYEQDDFGVWEIFLPNNADGSPPIPHGSRVKVRFPWSHLVCNGYETFSFFICHI